MPSHTLHPQSTNFRACGNLRKSTDHIDLFDTNFNYTIQFYKFQQDKQVKVSLLNIGSQLNLPKQ